MDQKNVHMLWRGKLYAKKAYREKIRDHNEAGSSEEVEQSHVRRA